MLGQYTQNYRVALLIKNHLRKNLQCFWTDIPDQKTGYGQLGPSPAGLEDTGTTENM